VESRLILNGFDALKIDYTRTDPNGESDITIVLVALLEKSRFVAVCTWGDDEAKSLSAMTCKPSQIASKLRDRLAPVANAGRPAVDPGD
jgi:hypothetical protein